MNIAEAANILNIQPDADHLVVKAAYHALAKRHHPDQGGDTAVMQRVNAAHDYMSTRTQQARLAEWERLQQPERQSWRVGQFDEYVATKMAEKANKAAASSPNPEPPRPGYTTRPWKPAPQKKSLRKRFHSWKASSPWYIRWPLNLCLILLILLILAGRLAVVAGMFYGYAESVRWAIKSLAHGAWVLLIFFPGIMVILAGLMVTGIIALNFLYGGWKGLGNYFMDRGPAHEGITIPSDAWTRKAAGRGRTRWI